MAAVGRISPWLTALRLRTLPLALSSIGMGSFLAQMNHAFRWDIFVLACLTTVFLQILSNLANDYGDSVHGADSEHREGPARMVQSGAISPASMRIAIGFLIGLSLACGTALIYVSIGFDWQVFLFFLGLGLLAILAAVYYTAGDNPYGYLGLGDLSVILFFGLVGVIGVYYLYTGSIDTEIALPGITCGMFATAVLNVNNIRDIESDKKAGKNSIPVRIGRENAIFYHIALIAVGWMAAILFTLLNYNSPWQFAYLICLPMFMMNVRGVMTKTKSAELDPYLRQMALSTLVFVLLFGLCMIYF